MKTARLFLLFAAALFAATPKGQAQNIIEESKNLYSTEELLASISVTSERNNLSIQSVPQLQGGVRITTDDRESIEITYRKKSRTNSRSRAIDYIDLIRVSVNSGPQGASILMHAPNPVRWDPDHEAGIVELDIVVPTDCHVEIDAAYFDVDATGPLSAMIIPSSLGKIQVSGVHGVVLINTANRKVILEDISGEIDVSTSNADLEAFEVNCRNRQATFSNEAGDIIIEGVSGSLNVKNSFGRIDIERFAPIDGKNYIRGQAGPILIQIDSMTGGEIVLRNQNEDIEIVVPKSISSEFSLAVGDDGKIEAIGLEMVADIVQHDRLILHSGSIASRISGSIRGEGNIYLTGVE